MDLINILLMMLESFTATEITCIWGVYRKWNDLNSFFGYFMIFNVVVYPSVFSSDVKRRSLKNMLTAVMSLSILLVDSAIPWILQWEDNCANLPSRCLESRAVFV
jgi:hypothetical protein